MKLLFAATARCPCGAGLAYDEDSSEGVHGAWDCSAILLGTADKTKQHEARLPFAFYDVKDESQPSSQGATTRPPEMGRVHWIVHFDCATCGEKWKTEPRPVDMRRIWYGGPCPKCGEPESLEHGGDNPKLRRFSESVIVGAKEPS